MKSLTIIDKHTVQLELSFVYWSRIGKNVMQVQYVLGELNILYNVYSKEQIVTEEHVHVLPTSNTAKRTKQESKETNQTRQNKQKQTY